MFLDRSEDARLRMRRGAIAPHPNCKMSGSTESVCLSSHLQRCAAMLLPVAEVMIVCLHHKAMPALIWVFLCCKS